ncbi:MAG TPA: hypothetical protein VFM35_06230 [Candidatus Binatia bacterium]|nr:hypothetical protein [Candidatus Binatia bacterium]
MIVLASGLILSLSGPLLAADSESKQKGEALRDEIKGERKVLRQDRTTALAEEKAQLERDRQALRDARKRKAPKEEIDQLRARVRQSEDRVATRKKELKTKRSELQKDRQELKDLKKGK